MSKQQNQGQPAAPQFSQQETDLLAAHGIDVSDPQNLNWGALLPKLKEILGIAITIIDRFGPILGGQQNANPVKNP